MKPSKKKALKQLKELIQYAKSEFGITVEFLPHVPDEYYPYLRHIQINSYLNTRLKLHTLLHELGHVLVRDFPDYKERFPFAHKDDQARYAQKNRLDIFREEIYAWDEGFDLAQKMKLDVNRSKYYMHMFGSLWKYAIWTIYKW